MIDAIRIFEDSVREHLAPVLEFLDDPEISEIMINGPNDVYIEKGGKLHRTSARFAGDYELEAAIRNAAQFVGRTVDAEHPILEGRLPDGSRFQALIPPAAPDGAQVAIRKFSKDKLTMERLVEFGAMPTDAAEALRALVVAKRNIMVAGGTGSGKTSLLNALSSYIPTDERVVVIEEAKEVQLQQEHVVQLEARPPDASGKGEIRVRDLFRATLRMRPDRIIIGEIRGGEAIDILQAMTSGHGGCMGTLHASHPKDTLARLETMCMMSDLDLPLAAMKQQIGSGLDIVVQVSRLRDGSRKLTHITEVVDYDPTLGQYIIKDIFARTYRGADTNGGVLSDFLPTGELPSRLEELAAHGVQLPASVLDAATRRLHGVEQ